MTSTLKSRLIVEALACQRKCMPPEKLCGLFLAIKNFSTIFDLAFRHHYAVFHSSSKLKLDKDDFVITTRCGLVFQFNKNFHIPALLRIAGRLIHEMDEKCPDEPWFEPFFNGLDDNKRMENIRWSAGPRFIEKYLRNHMKLPTVEIGDFSLLDKLGNPKIDTLIIGKPSNDKNLKSCRIKTILMITSPRPGCDVNMLESLKYNKKFLKGILIYGEISYDTALSYIKTTFSKVKGMVLWRVRLPYHDGESTKDAIDRLNTSVADIWAAMLAHSGRLMVNIIYNTRSETSMEDLTEACRSGLEGYELVKDWRLKCTIRKVVGETEGPWDPLTTEKELNVDAYFSPCAAEGEGFPRKRFPVSLRDARSPD